MRCLSDQISGQTDAVIPEEAKSPYAIIYDATSTDPLIDLSVVNGAYYDVKRQNGERVIWNATVDVGTQTPNFVRITYWLQSGDVPEEELLIVAPVFTGSSGQVYYAPPKTIRVLDRHEFP